MILSHLKVVRPHAEDTCPLDAFVERARRHAARRVGSAASRCRGHAIDGITCECAQVRFNGARVESARVERESYEGMNKVVEEPGIAAMPNANCLRAAKRVVGLA